MYIYGCHMMAGYRLRSCCVSLRCCVCLPIHHVAGAGVAGCVALLLYLPLSCWTSVSDTATCWLKLVLHLFALAPHCATPPRVASDIESNAFLKPR